MKIKEIADFLQSEFAGDGKIEIQRVASLDKASENEISFVEKLTLFKRQTLPA